MSIKFYVNEQSIELKTEIDIASDTIEFVSLNFTFCDSWKGYNKTVQFTQRTNTFSVNLGTNGTDCYLPNEITDGLCAISVFGNKDNAKRATTIPLNIRVKRSGFIEDGIIPSETQPSVIESIIQDVEDTKEQIDLVEEQINSIEEHINSVESIMRIPTKGFIDSSGYRKSHDFISLTSDTELITVLEGAIDIDLSESTWVKPAEAYLLGNLKLDYQVQLKTNSSNAIITANPRAYLRGLREKDGHIIGDLVIVLDNALDNSLGIQFHYWLNWLNY